MKRLLILEDCPGMELVYTDSFEGLYEITIIKSIREFMLFRSDHDLKDYDFMIADINLGDGYFTDYLESGGEMEIPFAVFSGENNEGLSERCLRLGAKEFVEKGLNKKELLLKIQDLLS